MSQYHFYLPEVDANIPVPKQKSHWFNNDKKIILGISDGIIIDEAAKVRGVSSIPDIWARPLLFQSAVKSGSKHPLRKRCIQEWRGLLSLVAMHKIKPELAGLEIIAVSLDSETLSTALRNLSPNSVQLEKESSYKWTDILMICFEGIPLGAFSPTTLVYTGADYHHSLLRLPFPFKDEKGFLVPPKSKEDGIEYMGEWLYNLQKKLNSLFYSDQNNPDHLIVGNINELINDWLKEIRIITGYKEDAEIDVKNYKVAEEIGIDVTGNYAFLKNYKIYERLLHPLKIDEAYKPEILVSDILLKSTRNLDKKVVVITEKIISEPVNIWNELRPKSLGENPNVIIDTFFKASDGDKINNVNIGIENGLWIRPELYFLSDKLLKAKGNEDILNGDEEELNIGTKYILPFTKKILNFFSPKEIKEKLRPVFKEDNGIVKFSFYLPVGDKEIKVEKTFKTKSTQGEGEILEISSPIIEIFPNYLGENWRRYYLFHGDAQDFSITPLVFENELPLVIRDRDYQQNNIEQKVRIFQINGNHAFPEAVEFADKINSPLGLILISKSDKRQGLKHQWKVGIDFGTSNTNVYRKTDSADTAERWSYNFPEYYRSITKSKPEMREEILKEYFFPTRKINLPIPTTLKIYNLAKKDSMVLDYFIYHPIEYKFPENVLSDIKWDGEGERKTEYFLESLFFLILIEIVKNGVLEVLLACSFPKAFSETNINVFKREWESVYDKLLKPDPKKEKDWILNIHEVIEDDGKKIKIQKPVFRTEGIAAGEYFANESTIPDISERANKEIAAICLDVGGATTDISIWYLNNIEFDASVLLAGRQLSSLLQKNNRVRELLFTKAAAIALEEKNNEPAYFSARLNLILKSEEPLIQENLIKHANNKDIQWLRQIIALEFAALSFYTAQVCVSTDEKVGGLLSRISEDGINLHWGGNAAKLINWIDFGIYNRQGIASKVLNATFFNCLNDKGLNEKAIKPKALGQLQSPGHKSEASGGLVVMSLDDSNEGDSGIISGEKFDMDYSMPGEGEEDQSIYAGIVCGENIELTDRTIPFYKPITNRDFFDENNRTKLKGTSIERLIRFIDILNFFGIKYGLFTEDTKIKLGEEEKRLIKDGVLKQFIKMQSLKESQRLIEPIFIMEIKLLLEIIKSKMN